MNYELIAAELIRSLRGRRSQAAFSRRLGYKSNIVCRWEAGKAFPSASTLLTMLAQHGPKGPSVLLDFFARLPRDLAALEPNSAEFIAAFLRELRGKTPIRSIASSSGYNRYSVSRWLAGTVEPRLPELLHLVEVMSRRLLDFLACCTDPSQLPSIAGRWKQLELSRNVAYEHPWAHAVLRALELEPGAEGQQESWISERLGLDVEKVRSALVVLESTGQVRRRRRRWTLDRVVSVSTSQDKRRAMALKVNWTETALERMRAGAPGNYGYSLFCVSRHDLRRMRDVHLEYVRAMQAIIAASAPGECVGLYCAQLLDLAARHNALEE